jgi:hypothetical protein
VREDAGIFGSGVLKKKSKMKDRVKVENLRPKLLDLSRPGRPRYSRGIQPIMSA